MTTTLTPKAFAELFTYSGGTNGSRVNAQGFVEPCATPRYDFDPITKAPKGLLIESARINLLQFSSRFEPATWARSRVTVIPSAALAPNGRWDACKIFLNSGEIAGNGFVVQTQAKTAAAATFAYSFYAKAAGTSFGATYARGAVGHTISVTFNLATMTLTSNGVVGDIVEVSKRITDVGNGWKRVEIVFTSDAGASISAYVLPGSTTGLSGTGDGVAGLYIWGAQLESGAFASSYIPSLDTVTARASIGSYYDSKGIMRYAAAGVARNSYEPSNLALPPVLMVEEQRTNILLKSSDMHLAPWSQTGFTRTPGKLAPDGTLRALEVSGAPTGLFTQTVAATSTVMTFSVYVKNVSRTAALSLLVRNGTTAVGGAVGVTTLHGTTPGITGAGWEMRDVGGGWFRCSYTTAFAIAVGEFLSVYCGFTGVGPDNGAFQVWGAQLEAGAFATSYIPSIETFTGRASIGTYFDSTGAMKTAAAGVARMTYNPADLTVAPWLVLEGQSTNLLLGSQIALGLPGGTTPPVVASTTVDGEACVAVTFTPASASGYSGSRAQGGAGVGANVATGTAYSTSVYVKLSRPLTGGEAINVYYTGSSGMGGFLISAANSSQFVARFSRTVTQNITPAASGGIYPVVHTSGALTSDLTVWFCKGQVEEGPVVTSYIPTTTATVTRLSDASTSSATTRQADTASSAATTRAGDLVRVDTSKGWCNSAEGTIFMEFGRPVAGDAGGRTLLEIGSTLSNRLGIGFNPTGSADAVSVVNGVVGARTSSADLNGTPAGGAVKASVSYGVDGLRFGCNGQALRKVALTAVPPMAFLGIGNLASGGNQPFFHMRALRYRPQKLTDAEVVALTA